MLLDVRDLKTYFRTKWGPARAVDGVSFSLDAGETFALVGESGCGKTVTALSIMQLVPQPAGYYAGGAILYKGRDLMRLPEVEKRRLRGRELSMIFQEPMSSLNPVLTIGYQLMEPLRYHQRLSPAAARKKALELLELVRLPDPEQRLQQYPHQLSGGMQQRVMIAIAMACEPGLLIADEPTTALDVTVQAEVLELMKALQAQKGTAILLITHDLGVVAQLADRVAVMYAGRIVEVAPRPQLLDNPAHPYTVRLLQSLPTRTRRDQALQTIEGRVPPAHALPPGCRFAPRCHMVQPACWQVDPPLLPVDAEHHAACILYDVKRQGRRITPAEVHLPPQPRPRPPGQTSGEPLLRLEGLCVHFPLRRGVLKRVVGYVRAVDGVDLTLRRGETLALVGESGCGKTTLGKAVLQLVRPTAGRVLLDGQDLTRLSRRQLHPYRRRMQIVFQDPYAALDPRMMVGEIVMEGMAAHGIGRSRREREERARAILAQVGLDPQMLYRYPHEFSGGQRQRIGIARCLAVEPEFLVCDEATSALDVSVQAQILNLLERLQAELGLTYLFITHNLGVVEYLADEVAVMYLGRIVERGPTAAIFSSPCHPYTRALLAAVPRLDARGAEKLHLPGEVPSPIHPPPGCHFHPRCPYAMPHCRQAYPPAYTVADGHTVRCFLYADNPPA
ncbi:MAG: ABC transporter ATP-binding protein [Candidatus Tectimicrobiota bacterium]|nr:MAG: ABC transporter ATP-binding protein [Candidatus Tectomicrobia bacterium]